MELVAFPAQALTVKSRRGSCPPAEPELGPGRRSQEDDTGKILMPRRAASRIEWVGGTGTRRSTFVIRIRQSRAVRVIRGSWVAAVEAGGGLRMVLFWRDDLVV